MSKRYSRTLTLLLCAAVIATAGCSNLNRGSGPVNTADEHNSVPSQDTGQTGQQSSSEDVSPADPVKQEPPKQAPVKQSPVKKPPVAKPPVTKPPVTKPPVQKPSEPAETSDQPEAVTVSVLVNKAHSLPENYAPKDLVYPNVPFIFKEKVDKRKLRKVAADALELLVAGAEKDGVKLAGVSGYRSEERQKTLYNNYVKEDGKAAADRYSARPGYSEHQTGLAIDLSGISGKCAATDCFADTKEAKWLAAHAQEYGFIIRYPEDKEDITGYKYEPWHIRYVGKTIAEDIADKGITLEEYYDTKVKA